MGLGGMGWSVADADTEADIDTVSDPVGVDVVVVTAAVVVVVEVAVGAAVVALAAVAGPDAAAEAGARAAAAEAAEAAVAAATARASCSMPAASANVVPVHTSRLCIHDTSTAAPTCPTPTPGRIPFTAPSNPGPPAFLDSSAKRTTLRSKMVWKQEAAMLDLAAGGASPRVRTYGALRAPSGSTGGKPLARAYPCPAIMSAITLSWWLDVLES